MGNLAAEIERMVDDPDASASVVVFDAERMVCINAVLSNVNKWGGRLTSDDANELRKTVGLRFSEDIRLIKATVTGVHKDTASIIFASEQDDATQSEKRREHRRKVSIPVKVTCRENDIQIDGTIIDAASSGCRIQALELASLPEEVLLHMSSFEEPVLAEVVWRSQSMGGFRLLWEKPETIG